jgi:hypothetical protein
MYLPSQHTQIFILATNMAIFIGDVHKQLNGPTVLLVSVFIGMASSTAAGRTPL